MNDRLELARLRGRARHPRSWSAALQLTMVVCSAALALTACSSTTSTASSSASGAVGDVLTLVQPGPAPSSLDPAQNGQSWLVTLGYEPLIEQRNDGSLVGGLATSWSYQGSGNTTFVLHLRSGVKFVDGSALTAAALVDDLRYKQKAAGPWGSTLAGDTFTATGPLTVAIKTTQPNPDFPQLLTQNFSLGDVISPAGLADPAKLGSQTFGAGPYTLDQAQTVAGNQYTYVQNPHFYDPASIHWKTIVVKVVNNTQSVLNAVKTGQADVALGDPSTISAAQQAGLSVHAAPYLWAGIVLADRDGTLAKPLADVRVRQALNYATDRSTIAKALFPGTGSATTQPTVPGGYGYEAALNNAYPYDIAKAKALLAAAGYPHGFSLGLVTTDTFQQSLLAQALAQQWKSIGVTVSIKDDSNSTQYGSDAFGGKTPAFTTAFGQLPIWVEAPILFTQKAVFNPFHSHAAALTALLNQEATVSSAGRPQMDQQVEAYLVNQAWFVPVVSTVLPIYARDTVTGVDTSAQSPNLDVFEIAPAS